VNEQERLMEHLRVNKHCDCTHKITWFAENVENCVIDREYVERHEPTYSGVSISFKYPDPTEDDMYLEFAANEEGWMYVSDWRRKNRPLEVVPIMEGILAVEANVDRVLAEMQDA
jgi:hypothetical protein